MDDIHSNELYRFLTQISHEVRTPMNTIIGNTELIMHESVSEKVYTSICDIRHSADVLMSLTNDIFDMISISHNDFELGCEDYCFQDIYLEVRRFMENQADIRGLEHSIDIDNNIPYRMFGDAPHIKQMLRKLLNHAFDASREGKVSFSAKCLASTPGCVYLRFDVTDSSSGEIGDDVMAALSGKPADEFYSRKNFGRTSLGIYLIKYLALKMGGKLSAKGVKGVGTTYTLLIQQKTVGIGTLEDNEVEFPEQVSVRGFVAPEARVLIVDDNLMNARIECSILKCYQINADIADSGRAALELLDRIRYDLVFMDHIMPGMDGIETTELIRKKWAGTNRAEYFDALPIIALTANTDRGIMKSFLSAGMNGYIPKPIGIPELERELKAWLPPHLITYTASETAAEESGLPDSLDLDRQQALENFGGDENEYRNVLLTLCRNGDTKGVMLLRYLEEYDYKNYIIVMHGILGVARLIGATWLAERAHELEQAAKQGNRSFLVRETPVMVSYFERLLTRIRNAIIPKDKQVIKGAIDRDDLIRLIEELKEYLSDYQLDKVEALFYQLAQVSFDDEEVLELIHTAEEYMMNYQYNELSETLERLSELLEG